MRRRFRLVLVLVFRHQQLGRDHQQRQTADQLEVRQLHQRHHAAMASRDEIHHRRLLRRILKEWTMLRKLSLVAIAAASLGAAALAPTSASAWNGWHGGWHRWGGP